jgi:hypothetical protein
MCSKSIKYTIKVFRIYVSFTVVLEAESSREKALQKMRPFRASASHFVASTEGSRGVAQHRSVSFLSQATLSPD